MAKEKAWSNAWFLLSWRAPVVAFAGWWIGGGWALYLFLISASLTCLLGKWMGRSEIYPLVAPVKKHSLRWFYYEGVLWGYVALGLAWLGTLLFVVNLQTTSWIDIIGLFCSTVLTCAYGLNCGHELNHTHSSGKIFSLLLSGGQISGEGHVFIHHNPKLSLSEEDYSKAEKNSTLFFLLRNFIKNAKKIEEKYLKKSSWNFWIKLLYLITIIYILMISSFKIIFLLSVLCLDFLLGGSIIYFQHYGLNRKIINGEYEPYGSWLTWDCNYVMNNFLFINLPRHCHHHDQATAPYYALKMYPNSNRLPCSYWPLIWLALLSPKRFFKLLNPLVEESERRNNRVQTPTV